MVQRAEKRMDERCLSNLIYKNNHDCDFYYLDYYSEKKSEKEARHTSVANMVQMAVDGRVL